MSNYLKFLDTGEFIAIKSARDENVTLGYIEYHEPWKQDVFVPAENTIWSWDCLEAIIKQLKPEYDQ